MVCVRVVGLPALVIPESNLLPSLAAVLRQVQVNPAADDDVGVGRVHGNRVAVRDLPLSGEVIPCDVLPSVAAVRRDEDAKQAIRVPARLVLREGVECVGLRETDGEARPPEARRVRQSFGQLRPILPAVRRAPDAAARPLIGEGRVQRPLRLGVKDD